MLWKFVEILENVNWSSVYKSGCVDEAWLSFRELFTSSLDSVAPLKEVRIKNNSEPWMSVEILETIRERDSWLRRSRKDKHEPDHYLNYRKLRNKVHTDIRNAKRHYMINKIDENRDNPKQLWKHLKDLGYQSNSKGSTNIVLDVDGKKCHDKKAVADHFNQFFTQIAANLVNKLPKQDYMTYDVDSIKFKDLYKNTVPDFFQIFSEDFVACL